MSDALNKSNPISEPDPLPWQFDGGIPEGDNPDVTRHLAESAVAKLTATLREIVDMNEVHQDMAPATAIKVWGLLLMLADDVISWIHGWKA